MQASERAYSMIRQFEGCRLTAYKDPIGIWTIGYGHTNGVTEGMKITNVQAKKFLEEDAQKVVTYLNNTGRPWTQNEFDALVSFGYNCGNGNLGKLIKNRNHNEIAEKMLLYNKAAGKSLAGLTRRRQAEQALFNDGYNYAPVAQVAKDGEFDTVYFDKKVIAKSGLNVREKATTQSKVLRVLMYNAHVQTAPCGIDGWLAVEGGGYIASRYVE